MFLKVSLIGLFFSFLVLLYEVENAISPQGSRFPQVKSNVSCVLNFIKNLRDLSEIFTTLYPFRFFYSFIISILCNEKI
jgi:hypothetical protein